MQELRALSVWSEGQVWVCPEQHGTITAVFKNQLGAGARVRRPRCTATRHTLRRARPPLALPLALPPADAPTHRMRDIRPLSPLHLPPFSPDWIPLDLGSVRPTQGRTVCIAQVNGGSQSFNVVGWGAGAWVGRSGGACGAGQHLAQLARCCGLAGAACPTHPLRRA